MVQVERPMNFSVIHRWRNFDRLLVVGWNEAAEEFFVSDRNEVTKFVNQCCSSWLDPQGPIERLAKYFAEDWFNLRYFGEFAHERTIVKGSVARTFIHVVAAQASFDQTDPKWQQLGYRAVTLENTGLEKLHEPIVQILHDARPRQGRSRAA